VDEIEEADWWLIVTKGAAQDPTTWLAAAQRLHQSAELLWQRFNVSRGPRWQDEWGDLPAALMLAGFALENLAKGLIVAREPQVVGERELARWNLRSGHEITGLFKRANLPLGEDERLTVQRLEYFARWAGRYPVPMKFEENTPIDSLGHGYRPLEISDEKRAAEWDLYRRIYARMEAAFATLTPPGAVDPGIPTGQR
jgi:hypothetical protein